jgi:hypothetical protein
MDKIRHVKDSTEEFLQLKDAEKKISEQLDQIIERDKRMIKLDKK